MNCSNSNNSRKIVRIEIVQLLMVITVFSVKDICGMTTGYRDICRTGW